MIFANCGINIVGMSINIVML